MHYPLSTTHSLPLWARWRLRADPRPLLLLALLVMFWFFWEYRTPAAAMMPLSQYIGASLGIALFGLLAALRRVQLFLKNSCASRYNVDANAFHRPYRFWTWFFVVAALTCLMIVFHVPLYLSFFVSRSALDRVAERALADPVKADSMANEWAGIYRVAGVEVIGRTVIVNIGRRHGDFGFAKVPGISGDLVFNRAGTEDRPGYHSEFPRAGMGNPVGQRIADDWFVMYSWYWMMEWMP